MSAIQSKRDHPHIHVTGLATGFLNRYNEPVMLLDLLPVDRHAWTSSSAGLRART
jgi:hypothetical protein